MKYRVTMLTLLAVLVLCWGCAPEELPPAEPEPADAGAELVAKYTNFRLDTDLDSLSAKQRQVIGLLIEAAHAMDEAFWMQAYGDRNELLQSIEDRSLRHFARINYGPWDRLEEDASFIDGVGPKSPGAQFYPADMTREEFEAAAKESPELSSLYTMVQRDDAGALVARPYREIFAEQLQKASAKLKEAAALAEHEGFKEYLELRAEALLTDEYQASDMAWMDMKDNPLDVVIGPIEVYEDKLFNYKAAFTTYVLVKDMAWSERLAKYSSMLPELQRGLPVPAEYKSEEPGTDSDLNAYDVVYYAGDCNAGVKTIAINLPNDEEVQLAKGSRRLQLKNAMRAKFDKILVPISEQLIAEDQRGHISFDAFFANTMFHEVAHGLGIKTTLDGAGTVRSALKELSSSLEEGKADVLGLYMITRLHEMGELGDAPLEDYYVTFLASIFRSVRFGASSAHGRANMIRFNFFEEMQAFTRDPEAGVYRVDFDRMREAMAALSEKILRIQGDGDYDGAADLIESSGAIGSQLQNDLDRLVAAGIPVDIIFEQGVDVLNL